ncbi:MAG: carbon-nitrogen hydrolase family protein [bacterium]|nr:carbon-nitrogen hydrolase family protein [bacterium]
MLRVGIVQMRSTDDLEANLAAAETLVSEAARADASWIALPENFAYLRREGTPFPCAQGLDGEILGAAAGWAEQHGVWLLAGTIPEAAGDGRVFNTSVLISPEGAQVAVYRKIHLFDVDLREQGGDPYQESASIAAGDAPVLAEASFGRIGLSVCYDPRFPELYRAYAKEGARFLTVPSAFARETGKDHWEVLLRARAIENQCFVLAPAQWGAHGPDRSSFGRAMIIDPWGLVLARAPDRPCVVLADCDLEAQDRIRGALPCQSHRRLF